MYAINLSLLIHKFTLSLDTSFKAHQHCFYTPKILPTVIPYYDNIIIKLHNPMFNYIIYLNHTNFPKLVALLISPGKPSNTNVKRNGDNVLPFLKPFSTLKLLVGLPFIRTVILLLKMNASTHFIYLTPKPNFFSINLK